MKRVDFRTERIARDLFEAGRNDGPTDAQLARVRRSVMSAVSVGGAVGVAGAAKASAFAAAASGAPGAAGVGLAGATGAGTAAVAVKLAGLALALGVTIGVPVVLVRSAAPEPSSRAVDVDAPAAPPPRVAYPLDLDLGPPRAEAPAEVQEKKNDPLRREMSTPVFVRGHRAAGPSRAPRSAVSPANVAAHAAEDRGLAEEAALLRQALADVAEGQEEEALAALERHGREHPRGVLAAERDAALVLAHCRAGHGARAREAARTFGDRWPGSALRARLALECEGMGVDFGDGNTDERTRMGE